MHSDDIVIITLSSITLLLVIILTCWLVFCLPNRRVLIELITLDRAQVRERRPNLYQISVERPKADTDNSQCQTEPVRQVRFTEEVTEPLISHQGVTRLHSLPLPTAPEEFEEDYGEATEEKKAPTTSYSSLTAEEEPDKVIVSQISINSQVQIQDLEACSEVLIDRVCKIERRLKQIEKTKIQ